MGKTIIVCNQKGGVGKTTTVANLACALATTYKKSVLVVDLDPLCALTVALGYSPEDFDCSIATVFENPKETIKTVFSTDIGNLSIIPGSPLMDYITLSIEGKKNKFERLTNALSPIKQVFDYIIIDAAPNLNTTTINGLMASDYVVVPAETKYQSERSLDTFLSTVETLKTAKEIKIEVLGLVATMFNGSANEDKEVLSKLQDTHKVLGVVKRSTAASKAVKVGFPCVLSNRRSVVAKEYVDIAGRIVDMVEGK